MRELLRVVAEVIAEVIAELIIYIILLVAIASMTAWTVSLLTGALHRSGLTDVPALSFWQSYWIVLLIYVLSLTWHAGGMINK